MKKKIYSMFPSEAESKAFYRESNVVSNILRADKAPIDLLIQASKDLRKKNG